MAFIYAASAVGSYPGIGNNCDYCDRRFEGSPEDVYAVARVFGREFAEDFLTEIGPDVFKTGKQVYEEYPGYANCTRCGWWAKLIGSGNTGYGKISEGVLRSFNINDQELGLAEVRAHLSRRFSDLYALTPRRFEEVVGDVYKQSGYDVILTPTTRDGGADLICLEEGSGNQLIVECKGMRKAGRLASVPSIVCSELKYALVRTLPTSSHRVTLQLMHEQRGARLGPRVLICIWSTLMSCCTF